MCGSGARWCARADAILDVPDMHVLDVEIDPTWAKLVRTFGVDRGECMADVFG
jgi:hypothetical protein